MDLTVENGCISITGVLKKHLYNALLKIVLYFSCRSFLKKYILDINPLSDIWFASVFSQSVLQQLFDVILKLVISIKTDITLVFITILASLFLSNI